MILIRNHRKIISFDLDGTLVSARFGDMVWNHGIPMEFAKKYALGFDDAQNIVMGEYKTLGDKDLLWYDIAYWLKRFNLSVSPEELLKRYEDYIVPAQDAKEVLGRLKERYALIVASNAARIFVEKELKHTGLEIYFDRIISATSDYGMVKKGEDFYKRLCSEMDANLSDFIHIGDHPVFDYMAPISLGIEAYLFKSKEPFFSIYHAENVEGKTITNLKELEVLL